MSLFSHKSRVLDSYCAEVGRDPERIERSALVGGNPESTGPRLLHAGVTLFIVKVSDLDLEDLRSWVRWRDSTL